jgi:hypothetical protein
MPLHGRFKLSWETSLPEFRSYDEVDERHSRWANLRRREIQWLGFKLCWSKKVDRPSLPARSIDPWSWIDALYHFFKRGF